MGLPPSLPWAPIELRLRSPDRTKNHCKQENLSGYPPAGRGVARRPQGRVGVEPSSGGGGRGGWSRGFPFPIWRSSQPTTCACAFIFVTEMLSQLVLDKYRYTPYWQKKGDVFMRHEYILRLLFISPFFCKQIQIFGKLDLTSKTSIWYSNTTLLSSAYYWLCY